MADAYFDFMDVGMGDCTFVRGPGGETMLVDFGSTKNRRIAPKDALLFLESKLGSRRPVLDYMVITHSDKDHFNQINRLLDTIPRLTIGTLLFSGEATDYAAGTFRMGRLRRISRRVLGLPDSYYKPLRKKPNFTMSGMDIWILSANFPDKDGLGNPNLRSIVLYFKLGRSKVILTGDATAATEYFISTHSSRIDAQFVKVPHHGSATSSSKDWVRDTLPLGIFVSADTNPTYKLPRLSILKRYDRSLEDSAKHSLIVYDDTKASPEFVKLESRKLMFSTLSDFLQGTQYELRIDDGGGYNIRST